MRKLNPDYVNIVVQGVNACPYFELLSMQIKALDWGTSRIEVQIQKKHLQPFQKVHGGVFSSLLDATCFWAVWPQLDEGLGMTTVDLKLNYLAPAADGILRGIGKSLKVGKSLCLAEAAIEDAEGKLLVHGLSTLMIRKELQLPDHTGLPPKFLD